MAGIYRKRPFLWMQTFRLCIFAATQISETSNWQPTALRGGLAASKTSDSEIGGQL